MNAHIRYASYIFRHKWYVFREACALGVPVLGILHDLSKVRPSEWVPYAAYFYGGTHPESGAEAQAQHTTTKRAAQMAFDEAWLAHQHANKHHWQHYVLHEDDGGTKVLPMPDKYRREMLADWRGAGRAITGKDNTADWFQKNRAHMILHPDTARWLYGQLGLTLPWREDIRVPRPDGVQFQIPEAAFSESKPD
jgi:hypothetical protein